MEALDKMFGVTEAGSDVNTEVRAGVATFLTMAYILLVNPSMLSATGIPFNDALFATALAAFVGCMVMAFWARLPFALAPGMGLNAYFAFTVAAPWAMAVPWEIALAAILVQGVIFLILSLPQVGVRTAMINSIPTDLKIATGAGIGMFLAIIGLREMGWVRGDNATLVNLGDTGAMDPMASGAFWAMIGLITIAVLMARNFPGAIIVGVLIVSVIGWGLEVDDPYNLGYPVVEFCAGTTAESCVVNPNFVAGVPGEGVAEPPTKIFEFVGLPEETLFAAVGALGDISASDLGWGGFISVMVTFLFVDIFDTAGTLYSVGRQAGYVDENDELLNSDEAFMSDATATIVGALCGTSTTTTYIESAAGIEEGGKTGLTAAVVGVLMLSGLFFADVFASIPQYAMACALVVVGAMMMRQAADIDWSNSTMAVPAFLTMVMMPFTYSIADGIAWGIISYCAIMTGTGKFKDINPVVGGIAAFMLLFYMSIDGDGTILDMILGA
ncbi:MAG: NCS2 family permease [Candidatus Thermoplasmatota archaeon]|nr:NCS2 family permease [Candidatus Thermoplasmatota archaeon]|tara:strand:+ start:398 stop:1894 length:1497 start_codon:yes stop_codon:yes gene_type:complete